MLEHFHTLVHIRARCSFMFVFVFVCVCVCVCVCVFAVVSTTSNVSRRMPEGACVTLALDARFVCERQMCYVK